MSRVPSMPGMFGGTPAEFVMFNLEDGTSRGIRRDDIKEFIQPPTDKAGGTTQIVFKEATRPSIVVQGSVTDALNKMSAGPGLNFPKPVPNPAPVPVPGPKPTPKPPKK